MISVDLAIDKIKQNKNYIFDFLSSRNNVHFKEYIYITQKYIDGNINEDFKSQYKIFWAMNGNGLHEEWLEAYFDYLNEDKNDPCVILRELYKIHNKLQFVFVSKLIHTTNKNIPPYDNLVGVVLDLKQENDTTVDLDSRINKRLQLWRNLNDFYNECLHTDFIKKYILTFRDYFKNEINEWDDDLISDIKILDSTFWALGKKKTKIIVKQIDITTLQVDAIVNAANKSLLGGGGVDGTIHTMAGPELLAECKLLNGCEVGQAKITKGYNLPAKYILHTVGPYYGDENGQEAKLLASCYRNSLELARKNKLRTIAFPCISTGVFRYPKDEAAKIAVNIIKKYTKEYPDVFDEIIFAVFDDWNLSIYKELL